jgi:hypothetical protein
MEDDIIEIVEMLEVEMEVLDSVYVTTEVEVVS